jgi:hypothetical protein
MAEEMRLEKELTVEVPLDRAWHTLSDLDTFASCLPDAELSSVDGAYTGRVTLGTDGGRIVCETTVRALDQDADEHVATILVHARQVDGPAIGSATVQSRCENADSATRVKLSAEVVASGYERTGEVFERAAKELFDEVGERLQQRAVTAPPAAQPLQGGPASVRDPDASTTMAAAQAAAAPARAQGGAERQLALAAAGILLIVLVRWLLGKRSRRLW